ncbi:MAG: hypothetical protein Q7T19_15315 [Caulobacter sp.]|nr:hypothetical protein [Caulobacter sp.]
MDRAARILTTAALLLVLTGVSACARPPTVLVQPPGPASQSPRQEIVVAADGVLSVAGKPTTLDRLPADLDAAFKAMGAEGGRADQTVIIVSAPTMAYETFMGLMNVLSAAGWYRIGAATVGR